MSAWAGFWIMVGLWRIAEAIEDLAKAKLGVR